MHLTQRNDPTSQQSFLEKPLDEKPSRHEWRKLMANFLHLVRFKQGINSWNRWRECYPDRIPNLARANLVRTHLNGILLSNADLQGANLSRANLSNADLQGANLSGADLSGAVLENVNLS